MDDFFYFLLEGIGLQIEDQVQKLVFFGFDVFYIDNDGKREMVLFLRMEYRILFLREGWKGKRGLFVKN